MSAQSTARSSVAVLGFKNLSGRSDTAWISTALSEMLAGELGAGEKLRMVPSETIARAKSDLSLPDTESLSADTLARLRTNLGSDFVVLGSYLDLGKASEGQIRLDLRLQDTAKGETVAEISQTSSEAEMLDLVSQNRKAAAGSSWESQKSLPLKRRAFAPRCRRTPKPCVSMPKVWTSFVSSMPFQPGTS